MQEHLLSDIAKAVLGAAIFALPASMLGFPLLLAFLIAGVVLGPQMGLALIKQPESIAHLSEIGLVLLMFILGLEINLKKLMQAGRAVLLNGLFQFLACFLLAGISFYSFHESLSISNYELIYLAVACSLSSTLIVVKILSDSMDLDALSSRITLGILVIQDLWAIGFLAIQPNLSKFEVSSLLQSFFKVVLLVVVAGSFARFILPKVFKRVGKQPELVLIVAMAWCFAICGLAHYLRLSVEMGALVAGVSIASFPYHVDIAAKLSSLRDFFITLFFVSLGLKIPVPNLQVIYLAVLIVIFVSLSRIVTVFPVLYFMRYGNRASLLPALNLSQLSEFSIVLSSIGVGLGHVDQDLLSAFIIAMVTTAILSSVSIPGAHSIFVFLNPWLEKIGFKDRIFDESEKTEKIESPQLVFLGFYREASSLFQTLLERYSSSYFEKMLIVDFNPEAHKQLRSMGVPCRYGDLSSPETLKSINIHQAKLIICTIPDHQLKGINNLSLLRNLKVLAPEAKVIVTAETISSAKNMYQSGAEYVFIPRLVSAHFLADMIERIQTDGGMAIREGAKKHLEKWQEILP